MPGTSPERKGERWALVFLLHWYRGEMFLELDWWWQSGGWWLTVVSAGRAIAALFHGARAIQLAAIGDIEEFNVHSKGGWGRAAPKHQACEKIC